MDTFVVRRSHLQSASYHTLSRIFSHCLDLSLKSQIPNLDGSVRSVGDKTQTGDRIEVTSTLRSPDLGGKDEILQLVEESLQDENGNVGVCNNDRLNDMISDFSLLIDSELDAETDPNKKIEGLNEPIADVQIANSTGVDLGKEEVSSSKSDQLIELGNEDVQDESNFQKLNHDCTIGDFEEGEIPDDAQDLDEELDFENNVESFIDDKSKIDSINSIIELDKTQENCNGLINQVDIDENYEECIISDDENIHEKDIKAEKKRKRVLTEERKAKKKKTKRMKRAKKLREEGVTRLRVPLPIKKQKEKQICKFFLNGRCQQGDKCKFSHNATPLTKLKPCNHFARGECLKGEQCPYDHDLSKYPCHKFISEGMCIRGANCKFSHTVKESSLLEKSNLEKENGKGSPVVKSSPVPKPIEGPVKVPKGIKFLSFKKHSAFSEKTGKRNDESVLPDRELPGMSNEEYASSSNLTGVKMRNEAICVKVSEASKILQEFLFSALPSF